MTKTNKSIKPNIKSQKEQIHKDMNLGEVVSKYPDTAEVLLDYGLHCVGCMANTFDTIEMGAKVHGMSDEEISEMVGRLNEVLLYKE